MDVQRVEKRQDRRKSLRRIGVGSEAGYAALEDAPVLGHGEPVGSIVAVGI